MDYRRTWPEPQALLPPPQTAEDHLHLSNLPPQQKHHAAPLYHYQQPLSYSTYPTNPSFSYPHYESNPIQSPHGAKDPYAPHGGYVSAAYTYAGVGASAVTVTGAIDGVYCNGEDSRTIAMKAAIRQYEAQPLGYVAAPHIANGDVLTTTVPQYLNPPYQNTVNQPNSKKAKKTAPPKNTKVVQSAYCGVCKVDCNSQDVLKSHKQGKKHKKNLHKLQESITPKPKKAQRSAPAGSMETTTSDDKEKTSNETKRKKTTIPETEVDLETKKSRVLEAGASAYEVRVCTICNVVVNSQKVYEYHLAGQKHAAMVEKFQEAGVRGK